MSILYTPAERDWIFDNYRHLTTKQIATHLGRTLAGIEQFKIRHKLLFRAPLENNTTFSNVSVMQALVKLCETNSNPAIRHAAKVKLFEMSGIPTPNIWGSEIVLRYLSRSNPKKI